MQNPKNPKFKAALGESRIFFGNLALSIRRRRGSEAAKRYDELCKAIDDAIRALNESEIIADALPEKPEVTLDLSVYKPI